MCMPLRWEVLDVQTRMVPPRDIHIPQTSRARAEGLGCFHCYVGRGCKVHHKRPHHGASLSPTRPKQDRRDWGV